MDEIIAKLRMEEPPPPEAPPEPMTARITKREFFKQREPTPPPLNYHSPYLANRFYSQSPNWIRFPHISAASLEEKALTEIAARHASTVQDKYTVLVEDDFRRIEQANKAGRAITPEHFSPATMSYVEKDELYQAIYIFSNVAKLQSLLRKGLNVSESLNNSMGYACIHYAAEIGHMQICDLLCEHGADPNQTTSSGLTPMMIAASKGHLAFIVALEKHGGDVTLQDKDLGRNPLHWAVMHDQLQTVQFLVEDMNMDVYVKDRSHRNALQLAQHHSKKDILQLLKRLVKRQAN